MRIFIEIGDIQTSIKKFYDTYGRRPSFYQVVDSLVSAGLYQEALPKAPDFAALTQMQDDAFLTKLRGLSYDIYLNNLYHPEHYELVPPEHDMVAISQFYGLQEFLHHHDCFEIDFVYRGSSEFTFEGDVQRLCEGDLCIVSPGARHNSVLTDPDSSVFPILMKASTFSTAFFSLLSGMDVLSVFFRNILSNAAEPNYLLFHTDNSYELRLLVRRLFLEHFRYDEYTNRCSIEWLNLLFAAVLRSACPCFQFSSHTPKTDCTPILKYIQGHYRSISLPELSRRFHYTVPYLSRLIKESTGHTFLELVKWMKMNEAARLLKTTSDSIEKISEQTGYHSADHFSRVFRSFYGTSPQKYRIGYRKAQEGLHTFPIRSRQDSPENHP